MQYQNSNNVMVGMMVGLLLSLLLIGLVVLNSNLMEKMAYSRYDYHLLEGVDYANGKV